MAPGVPFALMAGVQLLSVAAALGLAGAASFPRIRRPTSTVLILGTLLLASADALTAVDYGPGSSDHIAVLRTVGLGLIAVGLATGVLRPIGARIGAALPGDAAAVGAVVVPLGAHVGASTATAIAAGLASAASLRGRREDPLGTGLLAGAFLLLVAAGAVGEVARTSHAAALTVLVLRGLWALLVFAVIGRLALGSVLAKVVVAILAGVLAMAIGAVAVGSIVAGVVTKQQAQQAQRIALAQSQSLQDLETRAGSFAQIVRLACPNNAQLCETALGYFGALPDDFAAVVPRHGRVKQYSTGDKPPLSFAGQIALRSAPVVREVMRGDPASANGLATMIVLDGHLRAIGVAPIIGPNQIKGDAPDLGVAVYGGTIGSQYALQQHAATTYDMTVIVGNRVADSSLSEDGYRRVVAEARRLGTVTGSLLNAPNGIRVVTAEGRQPTVAFEQIRGSDSAPVAILAVSQDAHTALSAQKRAFSELFLTALGVMLLVSLVAFLVGQRVVDPVRRLTIVASRVRRGDLTATSDVTSSDEVGALARAFDAMTASVAQLTGDLRDAAAQEAALRARLETVLASMSDGVVATDLDGVVTSINRAAAELAAVDAEAALGMPLGRLLDVRDAGDERLVLTDLPRAAIEATLHRGELSPVPVIVDVAPLTAEGNGTVGHVIVLRDQTRDREVERMKTEFLSNVSHELRTPLTPIRGYAELLRRRPNLPRQQTESYVDTILDSTQRMSRVVDLLVDVASIEAGRVRADTRPVAVGAFVDERLEQWRTAYPDRAADLRRRVSRGLPPVVIDPLWVGKALDEFVDNAMKYTPPGTAVSLLAVPGAEGRVQLSVRDTGPGIDPTVLPTLFTDFVQADGSETRRVGGLGLGLSFVRRLAEAFDLGLEVRSEPGRGCEFVLDVPAASSSDVALRRRSARTARGGRRPAQRPTTVRRRRPPADPPPGE